MRRVLALVVLAAGVAGCFGDRGRPLPAEPGAAPRLTVLLIAPRSGLTFPTGAEIIVQVSARDLDARNLTGAGFVVRRVAPGLVTLDSGAVHFAPRADTIHEFRFVVPGDLSTNTQVDFHGIAYGSGGQTRVSEPSHLTIVQAP